MPILLPFQNYIDAYKHIKFYPNYLLTVLPMFISNDIFFLVASLVRKSFKMDIVDILSDWKVALPLLK